MIDVPVIRLDPDLPLPVPQHDGDAGCDLRARGGVVLAPGGGRAAVPTGIAVAIPPGYAGLVLPRSGLAARHGIALVNSPGLIDSGYRGELMVILLNTGEDAVELSAGSRIAQLVVLPVPAVEVAEVSELDESERGARGHGSSGH